MFKIFSTQIYLASLSSLIELPRSKEWKNTTKFMKFMSIIYEDISFQNVIMVSHNFLIFFKGSIIHTVTSPTAAK